MADMTQAVVMTAEVRLLPSTGDLGDLAVVETSNPFIGQPRQFGCLVVLASWLDPLEPVGMFATFNVFTADGGRRVREVSTLFAVKPFRAPTGLIDPDGTPVTYPVAVGRWMFDQGLLEYHSADRTDRGDRWARRVGGFAPPRVKSTVTPEATERHGQAALNRLNEQSWPRIRGL